LLYGPDSTGYGRQWIYYKFATGTESGTITVTISGSSCKIARMYAFRNVALSSFTEGGGFRSGYGDTISAQSVATVGPDRLAVSFVFVNDDNAVGSFTGESGGDWTETVAEFTTTAGYDGCVQLQTAQMPSAGTISGGSYTMSSSDPWGVRAFALKPITPQDRAVIVWRTYSTDYNMSAFSVSRTSFTDYSQTLATNPVTGQAWTWDEIDALEIGARAAAIRPGQYIQASEFWVVVNFTIVAPTEIYYGFNFNIPSNAIVDYVDVQTELWLETSGDDFINISLSRNSGISWMPEQPFKLAPLTTSRYWTYHTNVTGWCRWVPDDLNSDDFQLKIVKVTTGTAERVNLEYLAVYVEYYIKPTLSPRFMHVDNITLSQQGTSQIRLRADVKVVNARLEPVSAARVYVNISDLANHSSWLLNVATASNGIAAFTLAGVQPGHTYTLTVENIVKAEWVYDAESNYESSKSYAIT